MLYKEAERCALARTIVQLHNARRASRPQLKRDPLGSPSRNLGVALDAMTPTQQN